LSSSFPSKAFFIEGVLMLLKVRRAIFFATEELLGETGFAGILAIDFSVLSDFSSVNCWPEKIGSRI
jgi:hypothetical protein